MKDINQQGSHIYKDVQYTVKLEWKTLKPDNMVFHSIYCRILLTQNIKPLFCRGKVTTRMQIYCRKGTALQI